MIRKLQWAALSGFLGLTSGCVINDVEENSGADSFGRRGSVVLPFKADSYVVRVGDLEYTPDVGKIHGDWLQLRWLEDGAYSRDDVWAPINAIVAIEEKHH